MSIKIQVDTSAKLPTLIPAKEVKITFFDWCIEIKKAKSYKQEKFYVWRQEPFKGNYITPYSKVMDFGYQYIYWANSMEEQ